MPTAFGFSSICGAGEESTVGTAVVVTQAQPYMSESLNAQNTLLPDEVLEGRIGPRTPDLGPLDFAGDVALRWRYTNSQFLLKNFFGDLTAGRYGILSSTEGKSLTIAIDKRVGVWEFAGCKVSSFTLEASPETVTMAYAVLPTARSLSSVTNTQAIVSALCNADRNILFTDLNMRIGDQVDALVSGDEIKITTLTVEMTRELDQVHVNGQRGILEALESAKLGGTLSFNLARYSANTMHTWQDALTRLQARIYFSNSGKSKEILIPNLVVEQAETPVDGPEVLDLDATFQISVGVDTVTGTNISASTTDDSFNSASSAFPIIHPGATLCTSGFTNAANNGNFTVVSATSAKIIVTANLTTEAAGNTVTVTSFNPLMLINEV